MNPLAIVLISIPLIFHTYLIFWIAAFWMSSDGQPRWIAGPGAMIGASNFFELALVVAISLFGLNSGAALAMFWRAVGGSSDSVAGGDGQPEPTPVPRLRGLA